MPLELVLLGCLLLKSRDPHLAGGEKHLATNQTDHTLQNPKQISVECFSDFGRKENTERCQELDCKEVFGQNLQRSSHGLPMEVGWFPTPQKNMGHRGSYHPNMVQTGTVLT